MVFFYQFVNGLIELYPELYDEDGGGNVTQYQINFGKKWGNYSAVVELANGDITKFDEVVTQPLEKCLLLLAYKADSNYVTEMMHKAMAHLQIHQHQLPHQNFCP
jgi:hypothetical protein